MRSYQCRHCESLSLLLWAACLLTLCWTYQHWNKHWPWAGRYHHWRLQCLSWCAINWQIPFPFKVCWWLLASVVNVTTITVQADWWGGGSVMVWGGISYHRIALHVCCDRMNAIYYQDNVLQNHVIPLFHKHWDMHTLQQDNALAHIACVTTQYLVNNNVPLLEGSTLSPDLSPIEHLWDYLSQSISYHPQINNLRARVECYPPEHSSQTYWVYEKTLNGLCCCT